MKKQHVLTGLVAALALFGASSAQAAFQSVQTSVVVASATTGGAKTASFVLTLHPNASTATTATKINWTGALPGGGWKIADQMMKLAWNVTDLTGGIQIYTDNKNAAGVPPSNPLFVDPTPADSSNADSNPAGLLLVPAAGTQSSAVLPVAWSIKADTQTVGTSILPADPNAGSTGSGPDSKFQWLYMVDKNTPAIASTGTSAFFNADPFVTMVKQSGIHTAQGPTAFFGDGDRVSYVYLQADFTTAAAQATYSTNKVIIEAFIQ